MDTPQVLSVAEELAEVTRLLAADDVPAAMSRYVERHRAHRARLRRRGHQRAGAGGTRRRRRHLAAAPVRRPRHWGRSARRSPTGEPRRLPDVRTDARWPAFSAELDAAGFRSALVAAAHLAGQDARPR